MKKSARSDRFFEGIKKCKTTASPDRANVELLLVSPINDQDKIINYNTWSALSPNEWRGAPHLSSQAYIFFPRRPSPAGQM